MIKMKCAWCGKDMGEKPGEPAVIDGKAFDVSHGMCPECEKQFVSKLKEPPMSHSDTVDR